MQVKQLADCSISIRRFDTGEQINFVQNTIIDVDSETANHLLNMKSYDDEGNLLTDFVEV